MSSSGPQPFPEPLRKLYFYPLAGAKLIGSENPDVYPDAAEIAAAMVRHCHIRALMSLGPPLPDFGLCGVTQYHRPLPSNRPPTLAEVREVIARLRGHLDRQEPVWCHCQRGTDRTGCVLGAIMAERGLPADEIIRQVTSQFPPGRRSPRLLALWEPYADIIRLRCAEVRQAADTALDCRA